MFAVTSLYAPLLRRVRQHGQFVEWTAFVLILMILAEGIGAPAIYIQVSGALLLIGRIAHPFGQKADTAAHPQRIVGNSANLLATLNAMAGLAVNLRTSDPNPRRKDTIMQNMLLIHGDPAVEPVCGTPGFGAMMAG